MMSVAQDIPTPGARPATSAERSRDQRLPPETIFLFVAVGALLGGILLAGMVLWLWVRSRGVEDESDHEIPEG